MMRDIYVHPLRARKFNKSKKYRTGKGALLVDSIWTKVRWSPADVVLTRTRGR